MELNQLQCIPQNKEESVPDIVNNIGIQTDISKCKHCCHNQDDFNTTYLDAQTQTVEADFYDSSILTSVEDWKPPEGSCVTVADLVREAVEEAAPQSDYIYDDNSKLYYNAKVGYYYDPERQLFCEPHSGTYYYYDEDNKTYQFYCQVDPIKSENSETVMKQKNIHTYKTSSSKLKTVGNGEKILSAVRKSRRKKTAKRRKYSKCVIDYEEDISNTISRTPPYRKCPLLVPSSDFICSTVKEEFEGSPQHQTKILGNECTLMEKELEPIRSLQPCIKMLGQESAEPFISYLLIIMCNGATFGREMCNDFCLENSSVSRMHAVIIYNQDNLSFNICDLGSENGTWINEQRISERKVKSQPHPLVHGDHLLFGKCKFLVHIHSYNEACDVCDFAHIKSELNSPKKDSAEPILNYSKEGEKEEYPLNHVNISDIEMTVAELVQRVVDKAAYQLDYVYDECSQMYYSAKTGYYYDPEQNLFYEPYSGTYYSYNEETKTYHLYNQVEPYDEDKEITIEERSVFRETVYKEKCDKSEEHHCEKDTLSKMKKRKGKTGNNFKQSKPFTHSDAEHSLDNSCGQLSEKNLHASILTSDDSSSTLEEGEIEESSDSETDIAVSSPDTIVDDQDSAHCWPPCIRAIVQESTKLIPGSLLLITYNGGLVGRESYNTFCIPDSEVSKSHASITYDEGKEQYVICDLGSQNGTWINEQRLSKSKEMSQAHSLNHGDYLTLGKCKFLLHIHTGNETCDECEPGQVQAKLNSQKEKSPKPLLIKSKEEKERERKLQLKKIKKKFGLENMAFDAEGKSDPKKYGYEDLAHQRRKTVGSDNPYEKDEIPSSLSQSLSDQNKGYKILQKMGWSEGQSLGKKIGGLLEPIPVESRSGRAGLGSQKTANVPADPRQQRWIKVQKRYKHLDSQGKN